MKIRRTIENPRGEGEVFENEKMLGRVSYQLIIHQDFEVVQNMGNKEKTEIEGLKSATGVLTGGNVIDLWNKGKLTLRLNDGRKIDVLIQHADISRGKIDVVATGGFY